MDSIVNVNHVYHVIEIKGAQTFAPIHISLYENTSKELALYTLKNLKSDYPLDTFGMITITTTLEI